MIMYLFFGTSYFLILASALPALFLLMRVYSMDKVEKEPIGLIGRLVLMGILSTFAAVATELLGTRVLSAFFSESSIIYNLLMYFIVVAGSEEGFKYLLLKKATWNHPEFNCSFDGIVYAVAVALGFALWENFGYIRAYGIEVAAIRAVTAVPGHMCFGIFMGLWYGLAKRAQLEGSSARCKDCLKKSVLVPMIIHGIYDFIAVTNESFGLFLPFIVIMFIFSYRTIKKSSLNDAYL